MNSPTIKDITERDEELIGILYAISVVSKRLARNIQRLTAIEKGGNQNGKNVRTVNAD